MESAEAAVILRTTIMLILAGAGVAWAVKRRPQVWSLVIAIVFGVGTWLITESLTWDYRRALHQQVTLAHQQIRLERARTVRVLGTQLYAIYHSTAPEAQFAATDDRLLELAKEEGLKWAPGNEGSNVEPLPLRVRRMRRALFEVLPLWDEDAELLQLTGEWLGTQDAGAGDAFRIVLQGDGHYLMEMRYRWLRDQAIPALQRQLVVIARDRENAARVVDILLPDLVRIVPNDAPPGVGRKVRMDVTAMPTLQEEADRLQIVLGRDITNDGYY